MNRSDAGEEIRVGRQTVHLTRPEKLLFPDEGIDKRQLADYYEHIAGTMLPYLRDRPVTMERFPDGIQGARLIQKQAAAYFPPWIHTASMKKREGTVRHVICQDAATLVYLANQACITPHVWLSRVDKPAGCTSSSRSIGTRTSTRSALSRAPSRPTSSTPIPGT